MVGVLVLQSFPTPVLPKARVELSDIVTVCDSCCLGLECVRCVESHFKAVFSSREIKISIKSHLKNEHFRALCVSNWV